ncbi:MAG: hypothetical protein DSY43_02220 [Gammaproteobacteria bacterium]|nr:MAG: hypothetical protein DSY43_02220 [Gammaproteobacteria bacterium]
MNNIKLLFVLLITTALLGGCSVSNSSEFITWNAKGQLYQVSEQLEVGDIIITSKDWTKPISWFGHSAIMVSRYKIGEYPQFFTGYYETDVILWLSKKKEFSVLRYKFFDEDFKAAFLNNLLDTKYKKYKIVGKTNKNAFYCSQYIWYLYWKTAKDLGYELDIDRDGGYFVTPYDLLNSKYFNKVIKGGLQTH